ncbi:MAG: Holliday junction resolvase RuvX [Chitinophagales bacterium]|nr:Holliday junction resolvase RuvX [Chitinophagales bacterium]MDW8417979.1 Holliday junction resolvase RuvX [Chitinophagales bacterium]
MARIMAFDYGEKRTGIAVSDPLQMIAVSLATVTTDAVLDFVKKYCAAENVEAFVVGVPHNNVQRDNPVAREVEKFIAALQRSFPDKPVHRIDERFTSSIARQTVLQSGIRKKERRRKEHLDVIAANLILQTYLEKKSGR